MKERILIGIAFSVALRLISVLPVAQGLAQNTLTQTFQPDVQHFEHWLDSHGVERSVTVQDDPSVGGGRGLVASRRLEPGEVAVFVPVSATLRLDGGLHDDNDNWAGVMAHNLLHHKEIGSRSPLYSCLEFGLPKEAPMTPCRWSSRDRMFLQNSTFAEECIRNSFWRRQQVALHDGSNYKAFMHMIDLVCSRTLRGRDGSRQMVPLIDMANHAPTETGGGHFSVDEIGNVALIVGSRGVEKGQPVTLDYGARRVEDFLLHYGFVPHRCSSDSVLVKSSHGPLSLSWSDCEGYRGHRDAAVRELCLRELESFPTTLLDDLSLENSNPEGRNAAFRSVLSYRISKKSLLSCLAGANGFGNSKVLS